MTALPHASDAHTARSEPECVRVVVQARPLLRDEAASGASHILSLAHDNSVCLSRQNSSPLQFSGFDAVYNEHSSKDALFNNHVRPLVHSVFQGINATAFAYGQTSAGKSFTMDRLICAVAEELFARAKKLSVEEETCVTVRIGFIEIYKEKIRDLVDAPASGDCMGVLNINVRERPRPQGGVFLDGAREKVVPDANALMEVVRQGAKIRRTAATGMNARSSRSHSVITLSVQVESLNSTENVPHSSAVEHTPKKTTTLSAKLHLVDLAGSERAKRTHTGGERFAEGVEINKGLFALAKVISTLADNSQLGNAVAQKHVPYRDSKLTRLLQDSLGGTARTLLIACVSPADASRDETAGTLRYAMRAKSIQNRPTVNIDANAVEISDLRSALARARAELAALAEENHALRSRLGVQKGRRLRPETYFDEEENEENISGRNNRSRNEQDTHRLQQGNKISATARAPRRTLQRAAASRHRQNPTLPKEPRILIRPGSATSPRRYSDADVTPPRRHGLAVAVISDADRSKNNGVTAKARPKNDASAMQTDSPPESPRRTSSSSSSSSSSSEHDGPMPARVERALEAARSNEFKRTLSSRAALLEKEKAALERERHFLLRKAATVAAQHEETLSAMRNAHAARVSGLRARALESRRAAFETARAKKAKAEAEAARDALQARLQAANSAREELVERLAKTLSRVEHVKKALGKENRELSKAAEQARTELQRAAVMHSRQDAAMRRLQEENLVLRKKLRDLTRNSAQANSSEELHRNLPRMKTLGTSSTAATAGRPGTASRQTSAHTQAASRHRVLASS